MTIELWSLVGVTLALLTAIGVQAVILNLARGIHFNATARDNPPSETLLQARANNTVRNTIEFLAMFAPLVLIAHLAQVSTPTIETACILAVIARFAYIPLYVLGVPYLRSAVWFAAAASIVIIPWALWTS